VVADGGRKGKNERREVDKKADIYAKERHP
jgi:hypothetical protein